MASSPIYNWPEPDNSDLVKNGALAIRTLGNAIDTTMATMTPKSLVDAKGDLIAASANDTPARLAVGNNGETLVADSSASTGLRYQSGYNGNAIINGGYDIWQRGTSFTGGLGNVYGADRWMFSVTSARTYSRQAASLSGFQYCLRMQRNSGQTDTTGLYAIYSMESADAYRFAGKTVTLSYWAKAGANYSAASSALTVNWQTGTGTDQNVYTVGYTGSASVLNTTATLTTSWQRFSHTFAIGSTATEIGGWFTYNGVGTAGANDFVDITGIQMELGSVATEFKRSSGGTIQGELYACKYYYRRFGATNSAGFNGSYYTTTAFYGVLNFPNMRVAPSFAASGGDAVEIYRNGGTGGTSTAVTGGQATNESIEITVTTGASTAGNGGWARFKTTGTPYIELSSEL